MKTTDFYVWISDVLTVTEKYIKEVRKMTDGQAIELSIRKFKALLNFIKVHENNFPDWNAVETCPLCQKYFPEPNGCGDCPVFLETGRKRCLNTPYAQLVEAVDSGNRDWAIKSAKREIEFLEALQDIYKDIE